MREPIFLEKYGKVVVKFLLLTLKKGCIMVSSWFSFHARSSSDPSLVSIDKTVGTGLLSEASEEIQRATCLLDALPDAFSEEEVDAYLTKSRTCFTNLESLFRRIEEKISPISYYEMMRMSGEVENNRLLVKLEGVKSAYDALICYLIAIKTSFQSAHIPFCESRVVVSSLSRDFFTFLSDGGELLEDPFWSLKNNCRISNFYIEGTHVRKKEEISSEEQVVFREFVVLNALPPHPNLNREVHVECRDGTFSIYSKAYSTLQDTLRRATPEESDTYLYQIVRGLVALHTPSSGEKGFVHGRIHPKNFVLSSDGMVQISELGTVSVAGDISAEKCELTEYSSPERRRMSDAPLQPSEDIWAVGIIALMFLGQRTALRLSHHPTWQKDIDQLLSIFFQSESVRERDPEGKRGDFIRRCLKFDPCERVSAEELLRDPLFAGMAPFHVSDPHGEGEEDDDTFGGAAGGGGRVPS